jgi:hypothetical protein
MYPDAASFTAEHRKNHPANRSFLLFSTKTASARRSSKELPPPVFVVPRAVPRTNPMPILILIILVILVAQIGFWDTFTSILGAIGVIILLVLLAVALVVLTGIYLVRRTRARF